MRNAPPDPLGLWDWERDNALFPNEDRWAAARAYDWQCAQAIVALNTSTMPPWWLEDNPKDWK